MSPEELHAAIIAANVINLEVYYYWCTAIMILIHAGFLMYEMGASRVKHTLASGTKNILAFAYMIPTFWMFGWWIQCITALYLILKQALAAFLGVSQWGRIWLTMPPAFSGVHSPCLPVPLHQSCQAR